MQIKGIYAKPDRYTQKSEYKLYAQLRKGRKKEYSEKTDKGQETQVSSR